MKFIQEYFSDDVSEATYPEAFSLDHFKSLSSFKKRVDYANQTLKRISSGSSRIVYEIDDKTVLKIAKNQKGIAQNELEIEMSNDYYLRDIGLMAEVFEKDEEHFLWLEMERATKLTESKFKQLTGQTFEILIKFIRTIWKNYSRKRFPFPTLSDKEFTDLLGENELFPETSYGVEFFQAVNEYVSNYQPDDSTISDMTMKSTWGVVNRNGREEIVIVDYGVNEEIIQKYYRRNTRFHESIIDKWAKLYERNI